MKERDLRIDVLKGIGIISVIWAHLRGYFDMEIYIFHMPLFFFLSGMFYKNRKDFIPRRFKSLVIPFLLYTAAFSLIFHLQGGAWEKRKPFPDEWTVSYKDLRFKVKPMGFKHTGLFPEQAVNWDAMRALIEKEKAARGGKIKVLNLFAYPGGASVACAKSGAEVVHVDAAKGMVERAGENAALSSVNSGIRYIIDDCSKFVAREIRRGNRYDAIIMDPPSYGRGPGGEMWKIEDSLFDFVSMCTKVLVENPLFVLINSYTTGLQPCVINNILTLTMKGFEGDVQSYEVGIPTEEDIPLPCGASGLFVGKR